MRTICTALAMIAFASLARANDSEMEIGVGGLTLKQSDAITLDSEDLFISQHEVRVKYKFTNTSDNDIATGIAFPLPDLPVANDEAGMMVNYRERLNFRTTFNGQPLALDYVEQATLKGKDVSQHLKDLSIPLNAAAENFNAIINAMPAGKRKKLIADGFIAEDGNDGNPVWAAQWALKTTVVRQQTFPAHTTVSVEHHYNPIAGGSVAGALEPQYRKEQSFTEQAKKYCIEKSWLKSFDAVRAKRKLSDGPAGYSEVWLVYILKSGANWKGPIKDFRLVVDKGDPNAMVSFCAQGVKKISPTQFEVRKANFEPKDDLNILIINWAEQ